MPFTANPLMCAFLYLSGPSNRKMERILYLMPFLSGHIVRDASRIFFMLFERWQNETRVCAPNAPRHEKTSVLFFMIPHCILYAFTSRLSFVNIHFAYDLSSFVSPLIVPFVRQAYSLKRTFSIRFLGRYSFVLRRRWWQCRKAHAHNSQLVWCTEKYLLRFLPHANNPDMTSVVFDGSSLFPFSLSISRVESRIMKIF